jgi:predicted nucleic acid-binding Zn ribbon protein
LDQKTCGYCGKEIPGGDEAYCSDCKGVVSRRKRKRLWYAVAAAVFLLISGAALLYGEKNGWEFSLDALLGRPAAVINGEPVSRSEVRERFRTARVMLEKEYGKELFAGERGRALLKDLERDVLEKMLDERLVAQEARRMNIRVSNDTVRQEMQRIGREIYGNWENFQASLTEDGISQEYLMNHVRNLLLRQEVAKAITPPETDPDIYFVAWLTQDRRSAKVTFHQTITPSQAFAQGQPSCCGSGGGGGTGGCGTKQGSGALDPGLKSKASAAALEAYRETHPAEKGLGAKVTDYGCHVQVDIEKEGKIVASYSYSDGKVFEI